MQAEVLTTNDLTPVIIPSSSKIVTSLGIYKEFTKLSSNLNMLSGECANLPTKEWVYDQNYLTSHQPLYHKLDVTAFANVSSSFLTAHQSLSALNNYYRKDETSSVAQLKAAFSKGIDKLSIDFAQIYNDKPDKYLSAYVGIPISATFIQAVNRINEIDIYCAIEDIKPLTVDLEYEDISILSAPTILICSKAGIQRSSISVDTIEGIAAALNAATDKLKVFGTSTTLARMLQTYQLRNRVLEFQIAILAAKVKELQTHDSEDLRRLREDFNQLSATLTEFAQAMKLHTLVENPCVQEVADKLDEVIEARNNAADILIAANSAD